nr:MAG TPA: hypothetical protein [Bacteriophage sp.]
MPLRTSCTGFSTGFIVHYMMLYGNYILNIVHGARYSMVY